MSEIVLTEELRAVLRGCVKEAVDSKYRADAERLLQKEIGERVKEECEIQPKIFKKLCNTAFKNDGRKQNEELEEVLDLASELGYYEHSEE